MQLEVPFKVPYTDRMKNKNNTNEEVPELTVKDLIKHLSKFNPDAGIRIIDVESETPLDVYDIAQAQGDPDTVMFIVETSMNDEDED
jgi:hypothetical protein